VAFKALVHDTIIIHGTPVGNRSINGYFDIEEKRKQFLLERKLNKEKKRKERMRKTTKRLKKQLWV
jgi:hypothetical protein